MKTVLLVTQMEGGGSQRAATLTARAFREMGEHAETWFLFRRRGVYDDEPGVRCLLDREPVSALDYLGIFWRLFLTLRRHRPDRLVTFTHYSNVFGTFVAFFAGVKVRAARQTGLPENNPALARHLDRLFGAIGLYSVNLANSQVTLDSFASYPGAYRRRLKLVYNGIAIAPVGHEARATVRSRLGIGTQVLVVLAVGRLHPGKNYSRLLQALAQVEDVVLILAGDGEERASLAAQIGQLGLASRVHLLGDIAPSDLFKLHAASDFFVHPSLYESFGIAAAEAGRSGLPLCLSDIPALREVAGDGALFFDPTDDAALVSAMRKMRDDADLRRRLGERAALATARFTVPEMAKGFLAALESAR